MKNQKFGKIWNFEKIKFWKSWNFEKLKFWKNLNFEKLKFWKSWRRSFEKMKKWNFENIFKKLKKFNKLKKKKLNLNLEFSKY